MENPLVSVAVLTYNSSDYLIETLESIYNQDYNNLELIVSDDSSKDSTVSICKEWIEGKKERFFNTMVLTVSNNTGIPANYNRAVKACNGEWIKLIDGDDTLESKCISSLISYSRTIKDPLFIHASVNEYIGTFEPSKFTKVLGTNACAINRMPDASSQREVLLRENTVYSASMFMRKSIFDSYGYFNEKYKGMEDFPFLLNLVDNGIYLYFLDKVVANYRRSPTSVQNMNNFGGLYMRSSVDYYFDKKKYYYHGMERLVLDCQNKLRRLLLYRIDNNQRHNSLFLFLIRVISKIRVIICNKKVNKLVEKYGISQL